MNRTNLFLILPLLGILGLIGHTEFMLSQGKTFRVNVEGYDPRDILKGHYVVFTFRWNFDLPKTIDYARKFRQRYSTEDLLCVMSEGDSYRSWPVEVAQSDDCEFLVKGTFRVVGQDHEYISEKFEEFKAHEFQFVTGLEKFYIPEAHGALIEKLLREKKAEMEIQLNHQRRPLLKELYIDRRPWREYLP